MSTGDPTDEEPDAGTDSESGSDASDFRERLEQSADRAVEGFDEGVVDLLSWVLETETRARIYVHLRQHPESTSEEIADGTGLYPSTVREALAELHEEATVEREKRESDGAGNNPFEYRAIAPSTLVREAVEDIQGSLNDVFQLDSYMGGEDTSDQEPVTITVESEDPSEEEWGEPGAEDDAGSDADEMVDESEGGDTTGGDADEDDTDEADAEDGGEKSDGDGASDGEQNEDIDESL